MQQFNCEEFKDLLSPFADGELAGAQLDAVSTHLELCTACRAQSQQLTNLKLRLRTAVNSQPVALGLDSRIRARLRDAQQPRWWTRPAVASSFAAIAIIVTAGGWMQYQIAGVLAIGRGDHVHCTLERTKPPIGAMNRPLPKHHAEIVPVAQAALPGFQLLESHFCRFRGRVFTHIVFAKEDKRLSVIVTAKKQGESLPKATLLAKMRASGVPVYQNTSGTLHTAALETAGSWAYVVSDLDEHTNLQVMAKLRDIIPQADRE
ncbi:MAG: zf-HC2 domain-containing protein [Acidobacteria bacterium]|nr:zf-HC2 domain-containing protein [Acidobacteriota bacterium]